MRPGFLILAIGCTLPLLACSPSPSASAAPAARAASPSAPGSKSARPAATAAPAPVLVSAPTAEAVAAAEAEEAKYSYESGGRRDPFLTLVARETGRPASRDAVAAVPRRGEGVAGLLVSEIMVRGVVQMDSRLVALVQGRDGRSYNVHQTDRLADGTVKAVTTEGLVIMQDVNDPLSSAKQREVRKLLRSLEEAKP